MNLLTETKLRAHEMKNLVISLIKLPIVVFSEVFDFFFKSPDPEETNSTDYIDENTEIFIREINPLIQNIFQDDTLLQLKTLTKHIISDIRDYGGVIVKFVSVLEEIIKESERRGIIEGLTGPEKKEYCIQIILRLYEENEIDLKWIPRFLEPTVVQMTISILIDIIVQLFNNNHVFEHKSHA
jgi:hypothetical protein